MKPTPNELLSAVRDSLAGPRRVALLLASAFAVFALFVLVPVWTTPGNDIAFQLTLFTPGVYALMAVLSLLNGLVIVMQLHIRRVQKDTVGARQVGSGAGAILASLVATMGCAACYSSVLALIGLAGTAFIVENRAWFAAAAVGLALVAIYHSARKIAGGCKVCSLTPNLPET